MLFWKNFDISTSFLAELQFFNSLKGIKASAQNEKKKQQQKEHPQTNNPTNQSICPSSLFHDVGRHLGALCGLVNKLLHV
jgi:hypothetical protein